MAQIIYERAFIDRIDRIRRDGYEDLSEIASFPKDAARDILREIIETGCQSGNHANIELANAAIRRLPTEWLLDNLPAAVESSLFKEQDWQEWEFRRMGEMLQEQFPGAFQWLTAYAKQFGNPEVDEAIADFIE